MQSYSINVTQEESNNPSTHNIEKVIVENSEYLKRFISRHTWNKQDVDDIFQTTMLKTIRSIDNFRGESHIKTWLCGIAFNVIRSYAKDGNIHTPLSLDMLDSVEDFSTDAPFGNEDPAVLYERESLLSDIEVAYAMLPDDMRATYDAVISEGKSYEEASRELGVPVGTIRSRIHRSRQSFREYCNV